MILCCLLTSVLPTWWRGNCPRKQNDITKDNLTFFPKIGFLWLKSVELIFMCSYGLRYQYGLFRQIILDGFQHEQPDYWLNFGNPWEIERIHVTYEVKVFKDSPLFHFTVCCLHWHCASFSSETCVLIASLCYVEWIVLWDCSRCRYEWGKT